MIKLYNRLETFCMRPLLRVFTLFANPLKLLIMKESTSFDYFYYFPCV